MPEFADLDLPPIQEEQSVPVDRAERMVQTYRGWDALEQARGGLEIVDFDLSDVEGLITFNSRREVLNSLMELRDQLDGVSAEENFLRARVCGSIAYLRTLLGQKIPFPDYVRETLGVDVSPFSDEEIEDSRRSVSNHLLSFGLSFTREDRSRFESDLLIQNPEQIRQGIIGQRDYWLGKLRDSGVPVPKKLQLSVQFAEVDAYWNNWISGSVQRGITLSINLHVRKRYDLGRPLVLCLHEICGHAVQMSIWRKRISQGQISQACGLTTVHSPEMFVSEGLGQTVPDLLREHSFPPEFHLSRALQYHNLMILHNAHLMIYEGTPVEAIFEYVHDHLPLSDPDTLDKEIEDRSTNALFRSYLLSYGVAERAIRNIISGCTIAQKRDIFRTMYMVPMTPAQLFQAARSVRIER